MYYLNVIEKTLNPYFLRMSTFCYDYDQSMSLTSFSGRFTNHSNEVLMSRKSKYGSNNLLSPVKYAKPYQERLESSWIILSISGYPDLLAESSKFIFVRVNENE
ncbi:hypothetical protein BOW37_11830 [Solemya velum gill symbiont]|nr:hypothetical protein BOV94_12590 [Solemya velum gill symbiont]OOY96779.1 hypothetical protein BOW19_11490 [Solemya velum gill symbiont]OOZ43258.1 hypothetical protein BOW37_11830 [Solemya velum gill symbiont]OOZ44147.1 hypothetical protein BOW38_11910 [Solemya velum gill symbiont]OOZ48096.1 hypothetical protein BOW39_12420 [Solemya velum gill symbiont]